MRGLIPEKSHSSVRTEDCGKGFAVKVTLTKHVQFVHEMANSEKRPLACSLCDYRAKTNQQLKAHLRSHTGEKPYSCQICAKRYSNRAHLKTHILIHTEGEIPRPWTCSFCGQRFRYKQGMQIHEQKHKSG